MHRVLPLVIALLLAGCSGGDPGPVGTPAPSEATPGATAAPSNATREPLAFAAAEEEQTLVADVTIPVGETCVPGFSEVLDQCPSRRFVDLTSIIPVDAPVQVSLDVQHDAAPGAFVDVSFRFEGAMPTTVDEEANEDDDGSVLVVVMQPGGKVEAAVTLYFAGVPPQETHVHLEVRSVVRPTVIPSFLPISLDLAAGETLLAAGSGLEDLVVIGPSGGAVHHLGPFAYNATVTGRHIAIASGQGDIRLYAGDQTLRALVVQQLEGSPRAIVAGQETAWEFTIDGVPLFVGVIVENADNAGLFGVGQFHGNFEIRFERAGATVLEASETDCALAVQCGFNLVGGRQSWYIGDYLDEHLGPGAYQATASFEPSNNMQVREFYAFVVP